MLLKSLLFSLVTGVLFGQSPVPQAGTVAVETAYAGLINSADFPRFQNDKDEGRLAVLRNNPQETVKLLSSLLGKGQSEENKQRASYILRRLPYQPSLEILRSVNRTYDSDDLGNPARNGLISSGEAEDMKQFKQRITQTPDADISIGLANKMASSSNTQAQLALFELRDMVPGKWKEGKDVKELFARGYLLDVYSGGKIPLPAKYTATAAQSRDNQPNKPFADGSLQANDSTGAELSKVEKTEKNKTSVDMKPTLPTERATSYWLCGVSGILLFALMAFLFRKSK